MEVLVGGVLVPPVSTPPRPSRRSVAVILYLVNAAPLPESLFEYTAPHCNCVRQDARSCEDRPRKLSRPFSCWRRTLDACPDEVHKDGCERTVPADLRIQRSSFQSLSGTVEIKTSCYLLRWVVFSSKKQKPWWLGLWLTFPFLTEDELSLTKVDTCSRDLVTPTLLTLPVLALDSTSTEQWSFDLRSLRVHKMSMTDADPEFMLDANEISDDEIVMPIQNIERKQTQGQQRKEKIMESRIACYFYKKKLILPKLSSQIQTCFLERMSFCGIADMKIRFDCKDTREERKRENKHAATNEIWELLVTNFVLNYKPSAYVTIDEQLLGFRRKCPSECISSPSPTNLK
ncbi:hypothetical protein J6590_059359 [Homalodisca vitripennis]|nr:hypothetical protein J6590_059359 [Homalodisca vitripennis]